MSTHTPEPWKIAAGDRRLVCLPDIVKPINAGSIANAERIVACVNACKDINPEAVPDLMDALRDLKAQCQKWAPTIDQSRARAALEKAKQPNYGRGDGYDAL